MNLREKEEIIKSEYETAEILNKFFSNAKNPGISVYHDFNPVKGHMKNPSSRLF